MRQYQVLLRSTSFVSCFVLVLPLTIPQSLAFLQHVRHQSFRLFSASHQSGGSEAVRSQKPLNTTSPTLQMISFYRFAPVSDPVEARDTLFDELSTIEGLRGTVYIAAEGINAQMAVPPGEPLSQLLDACQRSIPFDPFEHNRPNLGDLVDSSVPTFHRLIVRTRDAVLRDGLGSSDSSGGDTLRLDWDDAGPELTPEEWDRELRETDSIVLDCRNTYESDEGSFVGAVPLETETFQDSWDELRRKTEGVEKDKPLHIFCTGGIRCVKVGAFLRQKLGFQDVRRLEHGIIGYQKWASEKFEKQEESVWTGENFLFDKRRFAKDEDEPKAQP